MAFISKAMVSAPTADPLIYHADIAPDFADGHASYMGVLLGNLNWAVLHYIKKQYPRHNQPHILSANIHLLRPTPSGRLTMTLSEASIGRSQSTLTAHATRPETGSKQKKYYVATIVVGDLSPRTDRLNMLSSWSVPNAGPRPVNFDLLAEDKDPNWRACYEGPYADVRRGLSKALRYIPRTGLRPDFTSQMWVRAPSGQRFTQDMMTYISNTCPNPMDEVFHPGVWSDLEKSKGVRNPYDMVLSSVNIEVKTLLPPEGIEWIYGHVHCKTVKNSRHDMQSVYFDHQGQLLLIVDSIVHLTSQEQFQARSKPAPKVNL